MSHDDQREALAKFDNARGKESGSEGSMWDLIRSIHSAPSLRNWATLESQPLCPLVRRCSEDKAQVEALVHVLLVGPAKEGRFPPPWGYVVWQWPSRKVVGMLDIRGLVAGSGVFGVEHLATRATTETTEQALSAGEPIPLPPGPLPDLYRTIMERIPLQANSAHSVVSTGDAAQEVAPATASSQVQAVPQTAAFSGSTAEFLSRAKDLIEESKQTACLIAWRQLYVRTGQAGFTVAVAGEFNRGKSTLINKLLGKDILPTADLPTTAMVTRVLYGPEPALWHILPGSRRHRLELSPDSWQRLVAKDEGSDPEGVAQVELPNSWLQETGIQFIDTPGAGDLT